MTTTSFYSSAHYDSRNNTPDLLTSLLRELAEKVHIDYACIISRIENARNYDVTCAYNPNNIDEQLSNQLLREVRQLMRSSGIQNTPILLEQKGMNGSGSASAVVFPIVMPEYTIGALLLYSSKHAVYDEKTVEKISYELSLISVLIENMYMYALMSQTMIVTQSIQLAAREIGRDPSPQHIIDTLRDYFFDAHVTSCAMLLFGPVREDGAQGPFEYIELRGTWSARRGSGIGVGLRFYLKDMGELLERLNQEKIVPFTSTRELSKQLDPLMRVFLQAERVRSTILIGLNTTQRPLGVLFVGTDKRHEFAPQELHGYRTLAEFLSINVITQMLKAQNDNVQQGRAALLDAVTDGVVMVLPGSTGARILTVNNRFREMFELPEIGAETLLADLIDRMPLPEQLLEDLRKQWLSVPVRDPATQTGEFHMIHAEGHPLDIEWYSGPVYQGAQVLGRIYTFHDVTPDRTAQRLRSAFLSRVSHELRTPLTSIRGFADFILQATGDDLPDLAREYTTIILNSAIHLNRVFTDMIEITRADAGELRLTRGEAHLPDIIIDVVSRMELQYKAKKQNVVLDLDDDSPHVMVDTDRIIQVMTNLLTNAIKYSPENTTITIKTEVASRTRQLSGDAPADVVLPALLVSVRDEGAGLSKEEAERVFMPFFRTEEAKKNKVEGVGLGLAVTRSLVEMHRGKIWAEPKKRGGGGAFLFTIPTM